MSSRWMAAGGLGLHWRERGEGRPMVFLHGLADSHRSFEPLATAFPARRTILLDLPGHGLSDPPLTSYAPEAYGEVLGAWWDALGLEDVDLVAHSYGGAIAQLLMLSHRDRVRSMTLIAPGGIGPEVGLGLRLLTLPGAEHVVAPFLGLGMRAVLANVGAPLEHVAYGAWLGSRPGAARVIARTARAAIDLGGQYRGMHERVHELEDLPPIALLWGERDTIIPVSQARGAARWLPGADVRIYPRARHWPHLERTAEVARDVGALLEREDRRSLRVAFDELPRRRPTWIRRAAGWVRAWAGRVAGWLRPRRRHGGGARLLRG